MKKINNILENTARSTKPPHQPSTRININEKLINRLFIRFSSMYGHIWKSQFSNQKQNVEVVKAEWGMALNRFTPVQIGKAIERCIGVYDLPPTLPQFVNLCKTETRSLRHSSQQLYIPLPCSKMDKQEARSRLQTIMATLKNTNKQNRSVKN